MSKKISGQTRTSKMKRKQTPVIVNVDSLSRSLNLHNFINTVHGSSSFLF